MRRIATIVLLLGGAFPGEAAPESGIVTGSDEFEFVYRVKLPEIKSEARLWIPLARTDAFQTVKMEEPGIPMKWEKIQDRDYGNDICVLRAQPADSGKTIELRYKVVRKEKAAYSASGEDAARFLRPEKLVPLNETFKSLAETATAGKHGDLEKVRALLGHQRIDTTQVYASIRPTHLKRSVEFLGEKASRMLSREANTALRI